MKRVWGIVDNNWIGWEAIFDISSKKKELANFEEQMAMVGFWDNRRQAESVGKAARVLKDVIAAWETLDRLVEDLGELQLIALEEGDVDALAEVESEVENAIEGIAEIEFRTAHGTCSQKNISCVTLTKTAGNRHRYFHTYSGIFRNFRREKSSLNCNK